MMDLIIESASNDILVDSDGRSYIDFQSGYGSVIVGHSNKAVVRALAEQADKLWIAGKFRHEQLDQTHQLIESFFNPDYSVAELYSTGMEALEFSLRTAAVQTGKNAFAGFTNSMHGKSLATSSLSWDNDFSIPNFHRMPFVDSLPESEIIAQIEELFQSGTIAAFFVEPIQGSSAGCQASPDFYRSLIALCTAHNVISVVDEVLTGFFRAGYASFSLGNNIFPDVIVFGKSMGNGFPVSAVLLKNSIEVVPAMLPKSTYSANPLACAVICATLDEITRLHVDKKVNAIQALVLEHITPLNEEGYSLRGSGALWIIEPPAGVSAYRLGETILQSGVVTSYTDRTIRLLPTATIIEENLISGLEKVYESCLAQL